MSSLIDLDLGLDLLQKQPETQNVANPLPPGLINSKGQKEVRVVTIIVYKSHGYCMVISIDSKIQVSSMWRELEDGELQRKSKDL